MKLVEEISLSNGLIAEIWDQSRAIAADTTKVTLLVRVKVTLRPEYFSKGEQFQITARVFGTDIYYELKKEKTFVANAEARNVFHVFLDEVRRDALPYLSKDKFPGSLARSKYLDIQKHPYKYGLQAGHPN